MNHDKYPIIEMVVKLASRCNLNCTYCYEYNKGDDSWRQAAKLMSPATATLLGKRIQEHMEEFNLDAFDIGFHGGEPLLMKPDKIQEIINCIQAEVSTKISFGLQTNGVLINDEYCELFKKNGISISVSIDGLKESHDKNRVDHKNEASWDKVVAGIHKLQEKCPDNFVGILAVIDIDSSPIDTFDYLASFGVDIDFLLPLQNYHDLPYWPNGDKTAYGKWYFEIYKEWINGRNSHIDVRFIKNIITQLFGGQAIYEVMTTNPIGLLTINTNGFMEGVDTLKSTSAGAQITNLHIQNNSISDSLSHEVVKLRQSGIDQLHDKCKKCDFLNGCAGGYIPNRYSKENQFNNPSVYCDDLYWLLDNIQKDLIKRTASR